MNNTRVITMIELFLQENPGKTADQMPITPEFYSELEVFSKFGTAGEISKIDSLYNFRKDPFIGSLGDYILSEGLDSLESLTLVCSLMIDDTYDIKEFVSRYNFSLIEGSYFNFYNHVSDLPFSEEFFETLFELSDYEFLTLHDWQVNFLNFRLFCDLVSSSPQNLSGHFIYKNSLFLNPEVLHQKWESLID